MELERVNGTQEVVGGAGIYLTSWENFSVTNVAIHEVREVHLAPSP